MAKVLKEFSSKGEIYQVGGEIADELVTDFMVENGMVEGKAVKKTEKPVKPVKPSKSNKKSKKVEEPKEDAKEDIKEELLIDEASDLDISVEDTTESLI